MRNRKVAYDNTHNRLPLCYRCATGNESAMAKHNGPKLHYIAEWAEKRGVTRAAMARALGVEKSTVGRWFDGSLPLEKYVVMIADILEVDEPNALFRHPDNDWLARLLRRTPEKDKDATRKAIEAFLELKTGTHDS